MTRHEARSHLRRVDPVLARLIDAKPDFDPRAWMKDLPPMDGFGTLVFQVLGQQLSVAATRHMLDRLRQRFGGALPTPGELLAAGPEELQQVGISHRKVATLRAVAEHFADGRWTDELFRSLSDGEVEDRLTSVSGIGPWTAHGFLIIALGREDIVMPGDLALRKSIESVYRMDHLPSPQEVVDLAERWRPWRSLATAYLFDAAYRGDSSAVP